MINLHRRFTLEGYLNLLETARGNGRQVHRVAQKIVVLRICKQMNIDLPAGVEDEIKSIINELYPMKDVGL